MWTPLGIHGLAISCILTRLTGLVFSLVYIACMRRELAWAGEVLFIGREPSLACPSLHGERGNTLIRPQSVIFNYTFTFPHAGWSPVVWVNWSEMIKLGLSGSVNVSTEFGMYEISTFFSQFEGKFIKLTVSRVFYHRRPWLKALSNFNYALSRIINTQSLIQKPCIQEVLISLLNNQTRWVDTYYTESN